MLTMNRSTRTPGFPARTFAGCRSALPATAAALLLLGLQVGPATAQVQTLGTAPPPSGTLSTPSGPRTVSSKPVTSTPVSSRPVGSSATLPSAPTASPSVVSGSLGGSVSASSGTLGQGARMPTFASPRTAAAPLPSGGIGTAALPFNEPVIDAQKQRFPLAPERARY